MKTVLAFVLLFCGSLGSNFKLPADFKLCKSNEDLSKCLAEAIEDALPRMKNGIPDLNVGSLEPLVVKSATIGEGKGAVNVVQNYENFEIHGISTAKLPKVKATLDDKGLAMEIEAFIPKINLFADYNFNGRVLLLPIVGHGKCQITLTDLKAKVKFLAEKTEKKGEIYLKMVEFKVELDPGHVAFNFEDLFDGNKSLGDNMNKILNDNWKDVFDDIASGYEEVVGSVCKNYSDQVFRKVAYKDLFEH